MQAWRDPADVAAAQRAMLAFMEQCGLSRHLHLVPTEQLPDQVSLILAAIRP